MSCIFVVACMYFRAVIANRNCYGLLGCTCSPTRSQVHNVTGLNTVNHPDPQSMELSISISVKPNFKTFIDPFVFWMSGSGVRKKANWRYYEMFCAEQTWDSQSAFWINEAHKLDTNDSSELYGSRFIETCGHQNLVLTDYHIRHGGPDRYIVTEQVVTALTAKEVTELKKLPDLHLSYYTLTSMKQKQSRISWKRQFLWYQKHLINQANQSEMEQQNHILKNNIDMVGGDEYVFTEYEEVNSFKPYDLMVALQELHCFLGLNKADFTIVHNCYSRSQPIRMNHLLLQSILQNLILDSSKLLIQKSQSDAIKVIIIAHRRKSMNDMVFSVQIAVRGSNGNTAASHTSQLSMDLCNPPTNDSESSGNFIQFYAAMLLIKKFGIGITYLENIDERGFDLKLEFPLETAAIPLPLPLQRLLNPLTCTPSTSVRAAKRKSGYKLQRSKSDGHIKHFDLSAYDFYGKPNVLLIMFGTNYSKHYADNMEGIMRRFGANFDIAKAAGQAIYYLSYSRMEYDVIIFEESREVCNLFNCNTQQNTKRKGNATIYAIRARANVAIESEYKVNGAFYVNVNDTFCIQTWIQIWKNNNFIRPRNATGCDTSFSNRLINKNRVPGTGWQCV